MAVSSAALLLCMGVETGLATAAGDGRQVEASYSKTQSGCSQPQSAVFSHGGTGHLWRMLMQLGYAEFLHVPDAHLLSVFEVLACCTIIAFWGYSAEITAATFWQVAAILSTVHPGAWHRPASIGRERTLCTNCDSGDSMDLTSTVHNDEWHRHHPIAELVNAAIGTIFSDPPAVSESCPLAWPLAVLLKIEMDLLVFLDEVQAGDLDIDMDRLSQLRQLWAEYADSKRVNLRQFDEGSDANVSSEVWLLSLTEIADDRVETLFEVMDEVVGESRPVSKQSLQKDLVETWHGLDRLSANTEEMLEEEPPASMRPPIEHEPGFLCVRRTAAMQHLEQLPLRQGQTQQSFWNSMAKVYDAFFTWRLADLGTGPLRTLLWRGTAMIERNFSYSWAHCAPAAAIVVLFRAERWFARMAQAFIWGGTPEAENANPGLQLQGIARRSLDLYQQLNWRMSQSLQDIPSRWIKVVESAEHRVRDRLTTWRTLNSLPEASSRDDDNVEKVRRHLERYQCHSSVGVGILPLVVNQPEAAGALVHAGRWKTVGLMQQIANQRRPAVRQKLAFLFMVYDRFNFPRLWRQFFADAPRQQFHLLIHASQKASSDPTADADWWAPYIIPQQPSAWFNISLVLLSLVHTALQDPAVKKAVILSQDVVPLAPFTEVHHWALRDRRNSWLCMDHEFTRSEPWMLLTRRHLKALASNRQHILEVLQGSGMCDAEEMVLQVLYLLGEQQRLQHHSVVFTQWALPKFFVVGRPAVLQRPAPLLGDYHRQIGSCGHPTTFEELPVSDLQRLVDAAHPQRYWFARKFARKAVVTHPDGSSQPLEDALLARLYGHTQTKSM